MTRRIRAYAAYLPYALAAAALAYIVASCAAGR